MKKLLVILGIVLAMLVMAFGGLSLCLGEGIAEAIVCMIGMTLWSCWIFVPIAIIVLKK